MVIVDLLETAVHESKGGLGIMRPRDPQFLIDFAVALLAGVVDVNRLQFGEEVHGYTALLAAAHASGFDAAEGQLRFAAHGGGVDVGDAGFDSLQKLEDAVAVFGVVASMAPLVAAYQSICSTVLSALQL